MTAAVGAAFTDRKHERSHPVGQTDQSTCRSVHDNPLLRQQNGNIYQITQKLTTGGRNLRTKKEINEDKLHS